MGVFDRVKSLFSGKRSHPLASTRWDKAPPRRGGKALFEMYRTHPALRLVIDTTATGVGAVQWRVYRRVEKTEEGGPKKFRQDFVMKTGSSLARHDRRRELHAAGEVEEAFDHPVLGLLADPNDHFPAKTFWELVQKHFDLLGEAFIVVERLNGAPVGLWAMPPTWVSALPAVNGKGPRVYSVDLGTRGIGTVPAADVIHLRDVDPEDPLSRGVGKAFTLGDELDTDEYAANFTKNSFFNNMTPATVVSIEELGKGGESAKASVERWKESLAREHQGPANAGKMLVTPGKVTFARLDTSFKDMALVELRKHLAAYIRMTFRIPPEIVGDLSSSSKAAAYAAQEIFARQTIAPRLETLRAYLQKFLVPMFSDGAELVLEYENPAPADEEFQLRVFAAQPASFTHDEWRALGGKRPHADRQGFPSLMPGQSENTPQGATPGAGSEAEAVADEQDAKGGDPAWVRGPLP